MAALELDNRRRRCGGTGKARTPIGTAVLGGDRLDDLRVRSRDLRRPCCRCRARPTWTCWSGARRSRREHWLGTDHLGRDELSRLIHGARISLTVGLLAPVIGVIIGGALGMLAGYFRGRFETFVVGGMDVLLAFPPLVFALAVTAYLGQSIPNITFMIGVLGIPAFTRVARAATLTLARREFVIAARALGATHARILLRELLPNVVLPLLAFFLLGVAVTIVVEGALVVPGPRRAAADLELGQHDRRGPREPRHRAVARLPAGGCDVPDRAFLQPRRRHAACAHRSASGRAVTGNTAAVGRGRRRRPADAARQSARGRPCRPHRRRRPDARRRRRIRLRQDHAVARHPAIAAEAGEALRPRDVRRAGPAAALAGETAQAARPLAGGRLPGPDDLAQPGAHDRHPDHRDAAGASRNWTTPRPPGAASNCSRRSASPRPSSGWRNIRTSSPAACASAWRSRSRYPASPSC